MATHRDPKRPNKYTVKVEGGKVILPMDFFWTVGKNQLDEKWAGLTVRYRPFFEKGMIVAGTVDENAECGHPTVENIQHWKVMAEKQIIGKRFRHYMVRGWNRALKELTQADGKPSATTTMIDFGFNGRSPCTQDDVKDVLFGDEVSSMVKSGRHEQPMALLFMWGYYLTMEGRTTNWVEKATDDYIKDNKYMVTLGKECAGEKPMTVHSWHRIGTKVAVNSFQTQLRRLQRKHWGLVFEGSKRCDFKDNDYEVVDIGNYLPQLVKTNINRVDGTKFMLRRYSGGEMDLEAQLKRKVVDLFQWADEKDLERSHVTNEVRNGEDEVHRKKEKGDSIGTRWKEDYMNAIVGVNDGGIRNANECRRGTVMAPRRKVNMMENLDSWNEGIPGNREIDSDNKQKIQDNMTTVSLANFIQDDLVRARTPNRVTREDDEAVRMLLALDLPQEEMMPNYMNCDTVWVTTEPKDNNCPWPSGRGGIAITCCKDAFSTNSNCKFAFCLPCTTKLRNGLEDISGSSSRKSNRRKTNQNISTIQSTGNTAKKKNGGECGSHTLRDMLDLNNIQSDKAYLKRNNESRQGAENIATHCVFCGLKF